MGEAKKYTDGGAWDVEEFKKQGLWSLDLEKRFGEAAAASYAVGSDILLEWTHDAMEALAKMPRGSHVGQLEDSWLAQLLPKQFLTRYDYEFVYAMYVTLAGLQMKIRHNVELVAHTVLDEIIFFMAAEASREIVKEVKPDLPGDWIDWIYDLFDDCDVFTCLYSGICLPEDHNYHFIHWLEWQFFCDARNAQNS